LNMEKRKMKSLTAKTKNPRRNWRSMYKKTKLREIIKRKGWFGFRKMELKMKSIIKIVKWNDKKKHVIVLPEAKNWGSESESETWMNEYSVTSS
jgi:hypothetical protein